MIAELLRARPARVRARHFALAAALSLAVLCPAPAQAQTAEDSATAQALFERAKRLMADGNYQDACPLFEESERIEQRSGTRLNLADCYERTGRYASAWSMFLNAAALAKGTHPEREAVARERAAALAPKLSKLVVTAPAAPPPGLEITRDGVAMGPAQLGVLLPVDGGTHVIAATAPGKKPWRTEVTLRAAGQTLKIEVPELEAAPASPGVAGAAGDVRDPAARATARDAEPGAALDTRPSRFTPGVIASSVVTGALAVGAVVTGVLYGARKSEFDEANAELAPNRAELQSEVQTLGIVNLALLGGTLVSAGVTALLFVRGPAEEKPRSARVELRGHVMPGLVGVSVEGRL